MQFYRGALKRILPILILGFAALNSQAQSGNAGAIRGTVTDPSGAFIPNATVHLTNDVSGFDQTATTDSTGQFVFPNVPFNPYKVAVTATGFTRLIQSVEIRSSVGVSVKLVMQIS